MKVRLTSLRPERQRRDRALNIGIRGSAPCSAFGQLVIRAGCLCIVDRPVERSGVSLKAPIHSGRRSIAVDVCKERSSADRLECTLGGTGLPFSFHLREG